MKILQFATKKGADDAGAELDASCGYPKDGQDIGGGVHVPVEQGRTYHYASVIKHPVLDLYAIEADSIVESKRAEIAGKVAGVPAVSTVADADWRPQP
jgi:hypothetical protein